MRQVSRASQGGRMTEDNGGYDNTWTFLQSMRCSRVENAEGRVVCQVCGERRASGHVEIKGGPFDGRIVLLTCPSCGEMGSETRRMEVLASHAAFGYLDLDTGGPGSLGSPPVIHDDHIDTLDDWRADAHD